MAVATNPGGHENLIGDKYQIKCRKPEVSDDYLDFYIVTNTDGAQFEAQAFSAMPREREGLLQARRRRMKRIYRSDNFEDEFEYEGRRFLVSRVQRNQKEWTDLEAQVGGRRQQENLPPPPEDCIEKFRAAIPGNINEGGPAKSRGSTYAAMLSKHHNYPDNVNEAAQRRKLCLGRCEA